MPGDYRYKHTSQEAQQLLLNKNLCPSWCLSLNNPTPVEFSCSSGCMSKGGLYIGIGVQWQFRASFGKPSKKGGCKGCSFSLRCLADRLPRTNYPWELRRMVTKIIVCLRCQNITTIQYRTPD